MVGNEVPMHNLASDEGVRHQVSRTASSPSSSPSSKVYGEKGVKRVSTSHGYANIYDPSVNKLIELGGSDDGSDHHALKPGDGIPFDTVLDHIHQQSVLSQSVRSLPNTMLFYLCFVWSAWLKCDTYNFGIGSSVLGLFKTDHWHEIPDIPPKKYVIDRETFWEYLSEGLVPVLWNEGDGRVSRTHKIIGGVRFSQERSKEIPCHDERAQEWYGPPFWCRASDGSLDLEAFGNSTDPAFTVCDASSSESCKADTFVVQLDIAKNQTEIQRRLMQLQENAWLDHKTGMVKIDLALYNGEIDAFILGQDVFNFRRDGSVKHTLLVSTSSNLFAKWYYFLADAVTWIQIMVIVTHEVTALVKSIVNHRFHEDYIHHPDFPWKVGDWALVIVGLWALSGYIILYFQREVLAGHLAEDAANNGGLGWSMITDELITLISAKKQHEVILFMFALTMMIRFFKDFRGHPQLAVLSRTFASCCWELIYFGLIFTVVFSNFVLTSFLLFSSQLPQWATLGDSLNECFQILMMKFSFGKMAKVHPVAAAVWFWMFMCVVMLICLSMLLAVIIGTYKEVKQENEVCGSHTGFCTQLYLLWKESWLCRTLQPEGHYLSCEDMQEALCCLKATQEMTMRQAGTTHRGIWMVTRRTLQKISCPTAQVDFFWKVFDAFTQAGDSSEDPFGVGSITTQALPSVAEATDPKESRVGEQQALEEKCVTVGFNAMEGNLDAQSAALGTAIQEIISRLAEIKADVEKKSPEERNGLRAERADASEYHELPGEVN